jgi:hypothetical protein
MVNWAGKMELSIPFFPPQNPPIAKFNIKKCGLSKGQVAQSPFLSFSNVKYFSPSIKKSSLSGDQSTAYTW